MSENTIKIIASTAEGFAALEKFRDSLPERCKSQAESIESGFTGVVIKYQPLAGPAVLPANPSSISYGEDCMRVYYSSMQVVIPSNDRVCVMFVEK